jgi:hypothetical protein
VARRLTQLDEWPLHQTLDTFDQVETDNFHWSDGFWTCVGDPDGQVNLITALRFYQNMNVADAYACLSLDDGRQYNVRASRRLRPRIDQLDVGPIYMEILEGLRTFRFGCRDNPLDLTFDIGWDAAAPAWDETPGQVGRVDGRIAFMRSNYVQLGNLAGEIQIGDRHFTVGPEWVGARDHSWGVGESGTGGVMNPYAAPPGGPRQEGIKHPGFGFRQWSLVRFPKRSIFFWLQQTKDGPMTPFFTRVEYPFSSGRRGWSYASAEIEEAEFVNGERRLDRAVVAFKRRSGKIDRFEMKVVSQPVYMEGGGYWDGWKDKLGRGVYRGEDYLEHDVWDISHPTIVRDLEGNVLPQRKGAWAETYARFTNLDDPEETGLGLLECVIDGAYGEFGED